MSYRKIYEDYHGGIPVDETGRTYDIHHKDGNRDNNNIDNLVALTIEEHYNIHLSQNEYQAAAAIKMRMDRSSEEISRLNSLAAQKRVRENRHAWQGDGSYQRKQQETLKQSGNYYQFSQKHKDNMSKRNKEYVMQGKHYFQSDEARKATSERNKRAVQTGVHPFCNGIGAKITRKRVKDGTHHFQNVEKQRELSLRAKAVRAIRIKRIGVVSLETVVFDSISEAVANTNGSKYSAIQNAYKRDKIYMGYQWVCLGKGSSSTTISSESTDQVVGKSSALKCDDIV